jgi:LmbE family N-acetylglucosaminyl deacetylase
MEDTPNPTDTPGERAAYTRGMLEANRAFLRHFVHRRPFAGTEPERALFLAPHPDDIEIGCGGLLLRRADAGAASRLVFLTDGAAVGTPEQDAHFREVRWAEARAASERLGLSEPVGVRIDERSFRAADRREPAVAAIADELREFDPDAVFLPWVADQHPDHRHTNVLLAEALRRTGRTPTVYGYEVWSFAPPGAVVDVSRELERKLDLIRCYASQLEFVDYVHLVQAVATSHAPLLPGASAVEAFCPMATDGFLALVDSLALDDPASGVDEVLLTPPPTLP